MLRLWGQAVVWGYRTYKLAWAGICVQPKRAQAKLCFLLWKMHLQRFIFNKRVIKETYRWQQTEAELCHTLECCCGNGKSCKGSISLKIWSLSISSQLPLPKENEIFQISAKLWRSWTVPQVGLDDVTNGHESLLHFLNYIWLGWIFMWITQPKSGWHCLC